MAAADDDIIMSDVEDNHVSSPVHKRKRDEDADLMDVSLTPEEPPSVKRLKEEETTEEPSPPPPPPPPPDAAMVDDMNNMTPSQVEAFSRAQEEVLRLADEAEQDRIRQEEDLQRENEEAMREYELEQKSQYPPAAHGILNDAFPDPGCDDDGNGATRRENEGRGKQVIIGQ